MVQRRTADQFATRTIDSATVNQITALANDPGGSSRVGACLALGRISDSSIVDARAATLAALLTDPLNHVRFMAAEGMRYLPQTAKMSQLNAILTATATAAITVSVPILNSRANWLMPGKFRRIHHSGFPPSGGRPIAPPPILLQMASW